MSARSQTAPGVSDPLLRCIELCTRCHDICLSALIYGVRMGGGHAEEKHLRLMMDCAEICQASANFMLRESGFHARVCGVCADICESCADSCSSFSNDQRMQECVNICNECATLCRELSVAGTA